VTRVVWAPQAIEDVEAIRPTSPVTPFIMRTCSLNGSSPRCRDWKVTRCLDGWPTSSRLRRCFMVPVCFDSIDSDG